MAGVEGANGPAVDQAEAEQLVAELRQLAGPDPASVRRVVAEVLAALDRASGGSLREQLPDAIRPDIEQCQAAKKR